VLSRELPTQALGDSLTAFGLGGREAQAAAGKVDSWDDGAQLSALRVKLEISPHMRRDELRLACQGRAARIDLKTPRRPDKAGFS
jgi:hypothetical protein